MICGGSDSRYPVPGIEQVSEAVGQGNERRGLLLLLAAAVNETAAAMAAGIRPYRPAFREMGWAIVIEAPGGLVGLWSSWLGNEFHLVYPKTDLIGSADEVERLVADTLGVEAAQPVLEVAETAVEAGYDGPYKDADKPLGEEGSGQFIAYQDQGLRRWGAFHGPRMAEGVGRVWVDIADRHSNSRRFHVIRPERPEVVEALDLGHDAVRSISTYPFNGSNMYAPDGPTVACDDIQRYRNRFIDLAAAIAQRLGGAVAVNIDYGFVAVPEQIGALGYGDVRWLKGSSEVRRGFGDEVVTARRQSAAGDERLLLVSGNSVVPWSVVRRVPCAGLSGDDLAALLVF